MFKIEINGKIIETEKDAKLLPFLRDDLKLLSVKNGCSQGACGTCMVIVDGQAKKACVLSLSKLDGKKITTIEGLTEREREVYSKAFAFQGAVQCGFCTPGMVISAKALIDACPNPTIEQVKEALKNNICRCTGYKKIEQAVLQAASVLRGDSEFESMDNIRVDAISKVLGEAEYTDDMYVDGMVYAGAVRSPTARAKIISLDTSKAEKIKGVVTCIKAKDLPGAKKIGHLKQDWDVLIAEGEETHTIGDALVLIAAETKDILEEAKKLVKIEFEELEPVTSPEEAMKEEAALVHETGNLLVREHLKRGNADEEIAKAAFSVTQHYSTPFTEHAFLEPETSVCVPTLDKTGSVESIKIYSGDQGIYQTQHECADATGLPLDKVRVVAKIVGGGFGGKEDMVVQHHTAVVAMIVKRPVKMSLSRQESISIHPKRHAMEIDVTTACDENGILTALKATIIADTGAYASLGGPVLQRACTHAAGPYAFENIEIVGEAWYTNNPPGGAFRGFGVTQSCFAAEQNLNLLAKKVGISPWEMRYRNAIRPGKVLPNGQLADENTALAETLEAVKPYYDAHPKSGLACAMKNSGLGVGLSDIGRCKIEVKDGKVHAFSSAACIGQGMGTVIIHMLTKTACIGAEHIFYEAPDTGTSPNAGNTTASRQTLFTGEAACKAGLALKKAMDELTGSTEEKLAKLEGFIYTGEFSGKTDKMGSDLQNPVSHVAYAYATHLVDFDDDGNLRKVIAAHDSGVVVNKKSIEGQIEGGVTMALGYALTEDFPLEKGVPTVKFGTLGLLKSTQVPEIETILCCNKTILDKVENLAKDTEHTDRPLAWGAKGIGEITSIPTAPACALAMQNLDGQFRGKLPLENTAYSKKKK